MSEGGKREFWIESKEQTKERLFDKHHELPLVASEQYGRLYLLNQQGEIVISFTEAIDKYQELQEKLKVAESALDDIAEPVGGLDIVADIARETLRKIRGE